MDGHISNVRRMCDPSDGFDVVIVSTSTQPQAEYWQERLLAVRGCVIAKEAKVLAVHEDWKGGAGNGLGTLYAFVKANELAKRIYDIDLLQELQEGRSSVSLYHTAGKGTRLSPLTGSENNNKAGVRLPSVMTVDGKDSPMTILEAVIKQTSVYGKSRIGRLSVFWGDQVFVPSGPIAYEARHHVDILASCRPMPTAEEWELEGLSKYGLIAINENMDAAQVDKVSHATATRLLRSLGNIRSVGTSLGSFSVSHRMLNLLLEEFARELTEKVGKFDADPHFWMPMTLKEESYVEVMEQKNVNAHVSRNHYSRMRKLVAKVGDSEPLFGCVDVGRDCYWWDYGQVPYYLKNNLRILDNSLEARAMRRFLGIKDHLAGSEVGSEFRACDRSCVLGSRILTGVCHESVFSNVCCREVNVENSLLMNVSAKSIKARNCVIYNVASDAEEGVDLPDDTILVGVYMPNGETITLRSRLDIDGGKYWGKCLQGNEHSFEVVHKLNAQADVRLIEEEKMADFLRVANELDDLSFSSLQPVSRLSSSQDSFE